jgi:hypothetical protein
VVQSRHKANCANPLCSVAQVADAIMQHDDDDVRFDAMSAGTPTLLHLQQQREPVPLAQASFLVICGLVVQPGGQCSAFKHRYRALRCTPGHKK